MPIKGSRFKTKYFDYKQNVEPQDVIENRVYYDIDDDKVYISDGTQYLYKYYVGSRPLFQTLAYMGAGHGVSSYYSSMDRVSFTDDSVSNSYFNLNEPHVYSFRFSSKTAGYTYAGNNGSNYMKDAEKFNMFNPVAQLIFTETVSNAPAGVGSSLNSSMIGYCIAGYDGTNTISTIEKVNMDDDTHSIITYHTAIKNVPAGVNSTSSGYILGGSPSTDGITSISKLIFSTESSSQLTATLPIQSSRIYGANSTLKGYLGSGYKSSAAGGPFSSTLESFEFSTEITAALSVHLSQNRHGIGAMNSTLAAYFVGGALDGNRSSSVDKLLFSDESMIQNRFYLSESQEYPVSIDNADNNGYIFS